jgi:hypothetical protein
MMLMRTLAMIVILAIIGLMIPCMGISVSVSGGTEGATNTITSSISDGTLHGVTTIGPDGITTSLDADWHNGQVLAKAGSQVVGVSGTNTPMAMNIDMSNGNLIGSIQTTDEVIHYFDGSIEYWEYWGTGSFTGGPDFPARQHHRTDAWNHLTGEMWSVMYD